jgi:hypothetical protein
MLDAMQYAKAQMDAANQAAHPHMGQLGQLTGGAGAHSHSFIGQAMKKELTKKERAMMGTYNHRSPDEDFYIKLLGMRLRVIEGETIPFQYIGVHHNPDCNDVHLFVVYNNTAVTFQEHAAVFPSDETIAQLNMILQK